VNSNTPRSSFSSDRAEGSAEQQAVVRSLKSAFGKSQKLSSSLGFWNAGLIGASLFIVLILIEQLLYLDPWLKTLALGAIASTKLGLWWWSSRHQPKENFQEFYRNFSKQSQLEELRYAVDLIQQGGNTELQQRLMDAAIFQNLAKVPKPKLDQALEQYLVQHPIAQLSRNRRKWVAIFGVLVLGTMWNFSDSSSRLLNFWTAYEAPNPYQYQISPGNLTLEQGETFRSEIVFSGIEQPDELLFYFKTDIESNYRSRQPIASDDGLSYASPELELSNSIDYYYTMDGFNSPNYRVDVQNRPRLLELFAVVQPPAYTGLPTDTLRYPFAQITGAQGAELRLMASFNKPLSSIEFYRGDSVAFEKNATNLEFESEESGWIPPERSISIYATPLITHDTLAINLVDSSGLQSNEDRASMLQFVLQPVPDLPPIVELLEPAQNLQEVAPEQLAIMYRASDDYGLRRAQLVYELKRAFRPEQAPVIIPLGPAKSNDLNIYDWPLSELDLRPKDELRFRVEVFDNDGFNGSKVGRSETRVLLVPSLTQYFDELGERENQVTDDLEDISENFESIQERYDEFKESLIDQPEGTYEQQVQLEQIQQEQQEIEKRIEELNQAFEEIKEELSEKNLLSEETLQAYEELEQLMNEIDDPAFREALEQLQENLQQMDPDQMRQALEEVEFNEERYKERLERTLELFKQLKLNSDLEKLAQSYEELAEQSMEKESLLEELDRLEEQTEALSEQSSPKNEDAIQELQEFTEETLEDIRERLEQESSPNLQQEFESLAQKTREQMQSMGQQQLNVNIAALEYILQTLLDLSLEQEKIVGTTEELENQSQAFVELARQQQQIEQVFSEIADSLYSLSTEIPQFANRINELKAQTEERIQSALGQMTERQKNQSSLASRQGFAGLNELSYELANLMDQLQNSQSGSGSGSGMTMQQMMEQMQQMGEQQQQMNQQIQDMINDMQGDRLTQDQSQRLEQLSRQQNAIRKQLQELQESGGLDAGDELGSELQRLIEDMEDTINDLRGGVVDPILIERQQNILSRMLQAEDALQERDEEEQREGTAAEDSLNRPTPPMSLEELEQRIRQRLNDPNFTPFAPDYQRLIQQYFELLRQQQVDG
jgi:DNA polymerase III delta prime subunit